MLAAVGGPLPSPPQTLEYEESGGDGGVRGMTIFIKANVFLAEFLRQLFLDSKYLLCCGQIALGWEPFSAQNKCSSLNIVRFLCCFQIVGFDGLHMDDEVRAFLRDFFVLSG